MLRRASTSSIGLVLAWTAVTLLCLRADVLACELHANANVTTYEYDDAGRRKAVVDALQNRTEYTYDKAGNQKTMKDGAARDTTLILFPLWT